MDKDKLETVAVANNFVSSLELVLQICSGSLDSKKDEIQWFVEQDKKIDKRS